MTVTFAEKLARMPGYQAGVPTGQAPEAIAAGGHRPARLQRVAVPAAPEGGRGDRRAPPAAMNRYPDPDATLLRRRLAERYETEPGRVAVGNGSCEILLAAAEALCEPGAEILYAWPAFSMYPYLPALTGAREIRVPLAEGDVHDLDAMAAEVTAATQLLIVCNPNNPTATHIPAAEIAAFCERIPPHVTVILDEAYVEFQTDDDPDATLDLLADFPNLVVLRTFSKCYGLAGLRVGYAIGSAKFRAAVDAVRQPFSVNALAQAAGAEAILHQDDVAAPGREHDRRAPPGRGGAARARPRGPPRPRPTSPGSTSATPTRRRSSPASPSARSRSAPARRSATPATSASATAPPAENDRFLAAPVRNCSTNRAAPCYKLWQ